jgi:hypothetical protein
MPEDRAEESVTPHESRAKKSDRMVDVILNDVVQPMGLISYHLSYKETCDRIKFKLCAIFYNFQSLAHFKEPFGIAMVFKSDYFFIFIT